MAQRLFAFKQQGKTLFVHFLNFIFSYDFVFKSGKYSIVKVNKFFLASENITTFETSEEHSSYKHGVT